MILKDKIFELEGRIEINLLASQTGAAQLSGAMWDIALVVQTVRRKGVEVQVFKS